MAKRKAVKRVVHKKKSTHPGYHAEYVAMAYRLGGAGIVIIAGVVMIFVLKSAVGF